MRFTELVSLFLGAMIIAAGVASAAAPAPEVLDELAAIALAQNPELDSLQQQVAALEHEVTRAGAWNDPMLTLAYQNVPIDSFSLGEEPMSMLMVRYSQTIPYFGKTAQREGVARQAVVAKSWELEERRSQLLSLVKQAFYRLGLARQLKALTEEHVGLVEQLTEVVRFKYEVGRASQHDLLRLEVLRGRLKDDLDDFGVQDAELAATLNATLHRDVSTPIATPDAFDLPIPSMTLQGLEELAVAERAALRQLETKADMFRAAADLARFEAVPDPTLFASYGLRTDLPGANPGRDLVTIGVSVPLPLFRRSRYEAQALESSSQARSAESQRASLEDRIAGGLAEALATWERAAEKVATYEDRLLPQAQQVLDAALASYQVDRADFLSLFEAELELLGFERTIRTAVVDALVARATIEMLVGKELQ